MCSATLGPGAINLLLGVADATTNSTPLVALSAQVGMGRSYKESHQGVDLFDVRAGDEMVRARRDTGAVPEMVRRHSSSRRPSALALSISRYQRTSRRPPRLRIRSRCRSTCHDQKIPQLHSWSGLRRFCAAARNPILLAGHGAARGGAAEAVRRFAEALDIPVATTFHGKGVCPDDHPLALGAVGFMRHDYVNFGFDQADVIVAAGYELQEFDPVRINPDGDTKIIHIHRFPAEVDAHYDVAVGLQGDIGGTLDALAPGHAQYRPRRVTNGSVNCSSPNWTADGRTRFPSRLPASSPTREQP